MDMQSEMPELGTNIGVCLSRIKKVNKTLDQKDEAIANLNKLVTSLFNEVTAMLGKDSSQEATLEELGK